MTHRGPFQPLLFCDSVKILRLPLTTQPGNCLDGVLPKQQLRRSQPALGQTSSFKHSARPTGGAFTLSAPGHMLSVSILYEQIKAAFIRHQLQ